MAHFGWTPPSIDAVNESPDETETAALPRWQRVIGWVRGHWPWVVLAAVVAVVCWPAIVFIPLFYIPFPLLLSRRPTRGCSWRVALHWRRAIRGYHSLVRDSFILRYEGKCRDRVKTIEIASVVEAALAELSSWHNARLAGRVCVFVLPSVKDIQKIFGGRCAGLACSIDNSIVVPATDPGEDTIRHELAHLFTARWRAHALPLLNEGFAVWWQHVYDQSLTDAWASHYLRTTRVRLGDLVDAKGFYDRKWLQPAYYLAGSFCGLLIRHHGEERFRELYRCSTAGNFEQCFERTFNMTFDEAEVRWRREIAVGGVLRRRLERELCC